MSLCILQPILGRQIKYPLPPFLLNSSRAKRMYCSFFYNAKHCREGKPWRRRETCVKCPTYMFQMIECLVSVLRADTAVDATDLTHYLATLFATEKIALRLDKTDDTLDSWISSQGGWVRFMYP